jgi:hypothetical protein
MSWIVEAPNNNPSVFDLITATVHQIDGDAQRLSSRPPAGVDDLGWRYMSPRFAERFAGWHGRVVVVGLSDRLAEIGRVGAMCALRCGR